METGKTPAVPFAFPSERGWLLCLVAALAIAWFSTLELRGLFIPDEARYAEIPREMLARGDWVTPRLNDLKYFEKPPLQYWLTAASYAFFGEDEWTARLPAALLGFLSLFLLAHAGRVLWSPRAGICAGLVCGSTWGFYLSSQYLTLDMTLTACLTLVLCSVLLAQRDSAAKAWHLVAWAAAGLAVLSKGLVGIVLPAISVLCYAALTGQWRLIAKLASVRGVLVFLGIALPWFVAVQQRNPEFFDFFFIHEHVERFLYPAHHRTGPWWYYAPILLLGFMPWSLSLAQEAYALLRGRLKLPSGFSPSLFALVWATAVVVFFSASSSKLPGYIVPAFPALALILGERLARAGSAPLCLAGWGGALAGAGGLVLVSRLSGSQKFGVFFAEGLDAARWLYAAAALLLVGSSVAVLSVRRGRNYVAIGSILFGTYGAWICVFGLLHAVDGHYSTERLVEGLTNETKPFKPEDAFYSIGLFDHSVPFYLGRPVTLVASKDELAPGIAAEPEKFVDSVDRFEDRWRAHSQAYAIMKLDTFAALESRRVPMVRRAQDRRYVIVSRR